MNLNFLLKKHREIFNRDKGLEVEANNKKYRLNPLPSTSSFVAQVEKLNDLDMPTSGKTKFKALSLAKEIEYPAISAENKSVDEAVSLWDELSGRIALERRQYSQTMEER